MKFKEKEIVILTEDYSEKGIPRGSEGWVIEVFEFPVEGYAVEFIGDDGSPIDTLFLTPDVLAARARELSPLGASA